MYCSASGFTKTRAYSGAVSIVVMPNAAINVNPAVMAAMAPNLSMSVPWTD